LYFNIVLSLKHFAKALSFKEVFSCMSLFLVLGIVVKYYGNLINIFYNSVVKLINTFKKYGDKIITSCFFIEKIEYHEKGNFIPSKNIIFQVGLLFLLVFGLSNSMKGQTIYTWKGAGVNGGTGDTDFNTAANWNPASVPGASDEAIFNLNKNNPAPVTLSTNTVIGKLTIIDETIINAIDRAHILNIGNKTLEVKGNCSVTNRMGDFNSNLNTQGYYGIDIGSLGNFIIGGNLTVINSNVSFSDNIIAFNNSGIMTVNGTTTANSLNSLTGSQVQFNVGNSSTTTFIGNAVFDDGTTNPDNTIFLSGTAATTTGKFVFKGNVTWGTYAATASNYVPATYLFNGNGTQIWINSGPYMTTLSSIQIGDGTTTPTVNFSGTGLNLNSLNTAGVTSHLTVNVNATLNLGTSYINRETGINTVGNLTVNGTLKLSASTGGQTGSNFPSGFTSNTLSASSTVEYNSLSGLNQTIYATPTYGNLTLTNGTGSGTTIKTAGGNLTVVGNLLINPLATFASSTFQHSVGGNWTNNGAFTFNSSNTTAKVTFTGASNVAISGASATGFYNLELNKGLNTTSILDISGSGNVSVSAGATLTLTNGLLRVSTGAMFANNSATNTIIEPTSGISVNGGTTSSQVSYINKGLYRVISGTASIGSVAGNSISNATGSTLDVQGGTLAISGRLESTGGTYSQSGGTVTLNTVGNINSSIASFNISTTSNINITAGTVVFQNPNTAATPFNDINIIAGGTKTISGGTFQMGNLNTAATQTFIVNSAIPFNNFTVNATNAPNVKLVTNPLTIGGTLTLNGGNIDGATNLQNVVVTNSATAAIVRTSGYINYNLTRALATTGAAYNYPVGLSASANYLPASLTFTNLTSGNLTVKVNAGDETNLGSSFIDGAKSVNAFWALSGTAVSTNYSGSVTYNAGITDASVTSAAFKIGKYNGTWAYPSVTPTPSTIGLSFTGANGFGNLAVGECVVSTATAGSNQTVCQGATVTLAANSPTVGNTGQWSISSGPNTNTAQFSNVSSNSSGFTPTNSGTYTLVWTISNGLCTPSTSSLKIVVTPLLGFVNLQFPASGSICSSGSFTAYGRVWLEGVTPGPGAGSGITVQFGYSSSNSNPSTWNTWLTATYNNYYGNNDEYQYTLNSLPAGTYYYAFRYSNGNCNWQYGGYNISGGGTWDGTSNVSGILTVSGIPTTAAAGTDQTVCEGTTITLAANSPTVGIGQWSIISGFGGSVTTPSSPTSTFTGVINTTYTLRWTTSNGTCANTSDDVVIRINGINWANTQWPPNASICSNGSLPVFGQIFVAGLTEPTGAGAGIVAELGYSATNTHPNTWINWIPAVINPFPLLTNNNDEYMSTLSGLPAGTYYYAFRYSLNGCRPYKYGGNNWDGSTSVTGGFWDGTNNISGVLTVNQPTVAISGITTICSGSSTTLTASGANTYLWSNGSTATSITVSPTNLTTYTVTGTDSNNCTNTANINITVNPKPISTLIYHD
jgi:hypothetical protein